MFFFTQAVKEKCGDFKTVSEKKWNKQMNEINMNGKKSASLCQPGHVPQIFYQVPQAYHVVIYFCSHLLFRFLSSSDTFDISFHSTYHFYKIILTIA